MVDSARCCPLRVGEFPFRPRVLAAFSPAARDSSLGSRYKMTGISQRWCGLRSCKLFRITEGPGQRFLRRQRLYRQCLTLRRRGRRDFAALFLTCPSGRSRACWIERFLQERDLSESTWPMTSAANAFSSMLRLIRGCRSAALAGSNFSSGKDTERMDQHYDTRTTVSEVAPSETLNFFEFLTPALRLLSRHPERGAK